MIDQNLRAQTAKDLAAASLVRGDFVLRSGRRSSFYFDKYAFETDPLLLRRVARLLAELVPPQTDRLAGPELGAVALATAVSLETGLPFVIVRKVGKDHGASADRLVEGRLNAGERVTLIEDVLTTGGEALRAADVLAKLGATIEAVIAVVDRGEGALANLAAAGFDARSVFGPADLGLTA